MPEPRATALLGPGRHDYPEVLAHPSHPGPHTHGHEAHVHDHAPDPHGHGTHEHDAAGQGGALTLDARHAHEAETYDAIAEVILRTWTEDDLRVDPEHLPFANREHVDFLTDAVGRLGPLAGARILEVGVGGGSLAVWLALQGAEVVGIDVSSGIIDVARRRAASNGVSDRTTFVRSPLETFHPREHGLGTDHFDGVIGNNVVHHFDRELAMASLARLLAPGAVAVFCEPVLFLPEIARQVRNSAPVARRFPLHTHSPDERSLGADDFAVMHRFFRHVDWAPFQLLCRLQNFYHLSDRRWSQLERLDRALLRHLRPARRLCRMAVIELGLPRTTSAPGVLPNGETL